MAYALHQLDPPTCDAEVWRPSLCGPPADAPGRSPWDPRPPPYVNGAILVRFFTCDARSLSATLPFQWFARALYISVPQRVLRPSWLRYHT